MMVYLACAKEFGWLPEQVDKLDIVLLRDLLTASEHIKLREIQSMKL